MSYPIVERETDKYVDFITTRSFVSNRKAITRETKFLCVGGPFHGEYYTRTQLGHAAPWGYYEFNRASSTQHRVIFAWTEEDVPEKPEN
jgi:hypothetical protein